MNPFDLRGPSFLIFYFCLCVGVTWLLSKVYAAFEAGPMPQIDKLDTYQMATLRGGPREAVLLAVFTLLDRGLLKELDGKLKKTGATDAKDITRHYIEGKVLEKCRQPTSLDALMLDGDLKKAAAIQEEKLIAKGLYVTGSDIRRRFLIWLVALVVLFGTSGYKILLAAERGRGNIGFLAFASTIIFCVTAGMTFRRRTALGTETVKHLKQLFGRLHHKSLSIRSGGRTNEASQIVAVYGIAALSASHFPFLESVFRKALQSSSAGSCGSSCGSSCGGSCGSGCGGCGGD